MLVGGGNNSDFRTAMHESWQTSNSIRREDGHTIASFDPYYQVNFPSRFYDPAQPNLVGRPIDACYTVEGNGDRARGGPCQASTANGATLGLTWDDPRSPFNGVRRHVDVNGNRLDTPTAAVWYSTLRKHAAPRHSWGASRGCRRHNVLEPPRTTSVGAKLWRSGSRAPN